MRDNDTIEFACIRGGACCIFVVNTLHVTQADLQRWREEGRTDILQKLGGISYLDHEECRDHYPQPTGENLFCPFLRYEGRQAKCQIYETKPEACTIYQCGERSSATRLRVELNPQNCYDKTMETIRQKWLVYLQNLTQEKNQPQVVIIGGEKWPQPGEFDPEELPRLHVSKKWEWLGEKCLQTTAELKRYLIWGWI